MLTWLSTRSSVRVAFSRTAFSTAMSPVLLMKLDSMFRLWRLRFSRNMSATACMVETWVRDSFIGQAGWGKEGNSSARFCELL